MKTLIGGAVGALLGIIGMAIWFKPFLQLLAGVVPAMLLLGGCLALYLGFDELKDTWKKDEGVDPVAPLGDDKDRQISELKKEIDSLKKKA
ncbi:MAG: hypothetical protein ACOZF0_00835 [Thermodesulfobacteriota bacterium]